MLVMRVSAARLMAPATLAGWLAELCRAPRDDEPAATPSPLSVIDCAVLVSDSPFRSSVPPLLTLTLPVPSALLAPSWSVPPVIEVPPE